MPAEITKLPDEGSAPVDKAGKPVNHLALVTGEDGTAIAIPPGATLVFVTGTKMEDHYPAILMKVEKKKMMFHCGCRKPNCTRTFTWKIVGASGEHPKGG